MKYAFLGGVAGLLLTTSAHAVTVVGVYDNLVGHVNGSRVRVSPLIVNGRLAPCLTPNGHEKLGNTPYHYTSLDLTPATAFEITGYNLTLAQIGSVGALVGDLFAKANAHDPAQFIAEDQGALWETITGVPGSVSFDNNPGFNTAALNQGIADQFAWAVGKSAPIHVMDDLSFGNDVQAIATPEPASWALMLIGFGFAGAALRRRTVVA